MVKWMLRVWWIVSALVAAWLLVGPMGSEPTPRQILGALALVNATVAFAATAIVGRLMLLKEMLEAQDQRSRD